MPGVEGLPAKYREQVLRAVQEQAEAKKRKRLEKAAELEGMLGIEQDDYFAYIVGYTPGGAPYGITGRNGSRWMTLRLRKTKRRKMLAVPRRDYSWPYGKCRSDLINVELHWMPG